MVLKEVNKDLFTTSDDYALAYCKIDDADILRIITNTLIPPNETIRDAIKIFNERFDEYNKIFDVRQIKTKYTTTLNPLDKESLEKAIAKLNEIQQNNKSLELAKLFVKLYENELRHIGECYETNPT